MKISINGKVEKVTTVELFNNLTEWKLKINNKEILKLIELSDYLKKAKEIKDLKSIVKDLIADLSFDLEMTVAEGKELEFYLLKELSAFLELDEIWYIDNNSYEKGFEDGYNEGQFDTLESLPKFNFILILVMDRETTVFRFRTRDEARNEMRRQFIEAGGDIEENNDYATLNEDFAWVNDGDNHSDFDWRVVEVSEIPIFN